MINFRKIFELIFKSFDISGLTKLLEKLEQDNNRFIMVIKRHWIYGVLHSWVVLVVLIIAIANAYLLFFDDKNSTSGTLIGIFLLLNVFYWIYIIIVYLYRFYKIHGSKPEIVDIYTSLKKSKKSAEIFTKFFNQTIFLLLILVIITGFSTATAISHFLIGGALGFGIGAVNVLLLIAQLGFFSSYLLTMINQEMDFRVVHASQILFYDQKGVLGDSQSMNSIKIRTMNTKYPGVFGSFFNYGYIIILTEGDRNDFGEMKLDYVGNPVHTVENIQKIFKHDTDYIEKSINVLLQKYKIELGIDEVKTEADKKKLKLFLDENDDSLQELYKAGNQETKREIQELYSLIQV